jgi:hypothetical protein
VNPSGGLVRPCPSPTRCMWLTCGLSCSEHSLLIHRCIDVFCWFVLYRGPANVAQISKGHPLGATGLAQCAEICWQLRGEAGKRQVAGARVGLTHNLGLGGAVVVGVYRIPDAWKALPKKRPVSGGQGLSCAFFFHCLRGLLCESHGTWDTSRCFHGPDHSCVNPCRCPCCHIAPQDSSRTSLTRPRPPSAL